MARNDGPQRRDSYSMRSTGIAAGASAFDPGLVIEEAQVVLHKPDQPDFLTDFRDAVVLAGEYPAEVDFARPDADLIGLSAFGNRSVRRV